VVDPRVVTWAGGLLRSIMMIPAGESRLMFAPFLIVLVLVGDDRAAPGPLKPAGRLEHRPIREASGIVASRRRPGVFWVHNDSGNPPALFAVKSDGTLLKQYAVKAPNLDWEDIAVDDEGHLYIGDIGNNGRLLRVRAIYRIDEPDPAQPDEGPLPLTGAWYYRFSPEGRFDAEGLFIDRGRAVIVAKSFDNRPAELFALPLGVKSPLEAPALSRKLGALAGFVEPATGAALAAGGRRLAVCSYRVARVYGREAALSDDWSLLATVRFEADGIEAITWDNDDLILASEGRDLYRIAAATWRDPAAAARPSGANGHH
jgi:hypothetical protein